MKNAWAALLVLLSACATELPAPVPISSLSSAPGLPSRRFEQSPEGYYFQPAGLADDFPEETTTRAKIESDLETLRKLGAHYLRFGIGWDGVEESPGHYRWRYWDDLVNLAPKYGVTLIPYVCYTPKWLNPDPRNYWRNPPRDLKRFGGFMYEIARRYRGRIRSWELWNEPDLTQYWTGTAQQFAEMVREGARQVRRADPDAIVVLGGMAHGRGPFFDALMKEFRIGADFDVVNMHGYLETWDPGRAEEYPNRIAAMRALMREGAPRADLWMAEFGYSDFRQFPDRASEWAYAVHDYEHTEEFQASALWRHHVLAAASGGLSLVTWYRIHDLPKSESVIGDENNRYLGIIDVNGKPKPAFYALKLYEKLFDRPVRLIDAAVRVKGPKDSQSIVHVFEKTDGSLVVTAWLRSSLKGESGNSGGRSPDLREETLSIELPEKDRGADTVLYDLRGKASSAGPAEAALSRVRLTGPGVFIAEVALSRSPDQRP